MSNEVKVTGGQVSRSADPEARRFEELVDGAGAPAKENKMIVTNNGMQMLNTLTMPVDLQKRVADGRLTQAAAVKIVRRRQAEEVLWALARQAGIAGDLEAHVLA